MLPSFTTSCSICDAQSDQCKTSHGPKLHGFRRFVHFQFLAAAGFLLTSGAVGKVAYAQQSLLTQSDDAAVRQAGKEYIAAIRDGNPKTIAGFWTANGTYTDERGQSIRARELVEKSFRAGQPARHQTEFSGVTLRYLTKDVVVEEGRCTIAAPVIGAAPNGLVEKSQNKLTAQLSGRFSALWVRQDGSWKLDQLNEWREEINIPSKNNTAGDLVSLEPFVGQWSGNSAKMSIQFSSKWNPDRTFLHRELALAQDGKEVLSGVQEVGWDPVSQSIKSWVFNGDGGHAEGHWNLAGNSWLVLTSGVLPDGRSTSNTQIFKFVDANTLVWKFVNGRVDGQPTADLEMTLKRKTGAK